MAKGLRLRWEPELCVDASAMVACTWIDRLCYGGGGGKQSKVLAVVGILGEKKRKMRWWRGGVEEVDVSGKASR